jgi:hypothetical protein
MHYIIKTFQLIFCLNFIVYKKCFKCGEYKDGKKSDNNVN